LCALLLQERIVRSCKSLSVLSNPGGTPLTRDPAVRIIPMSRRHVDAVAGLHQRGINQGFLSVLGDRFLRFLYKATLRHDQTFGRVAEMDGRVVGFICCTETIGGLYRHMIQEYFLELVWVSLPRILCWTNIKKAFETLFYPSYTSGLLPKAEILSVAVDETARGQGLGRKLMVEALAEFRLRKIEQVKVAVGEMLPSNDYYRKLNFVFQGRQRHHGYNLNVYTITTGIATPSIPPYTQPALPQ